jgi:hypothetical protein
MTTPKTNPLIPPPFIGLFPDEDRAIRFDGYYELWAA